MGDTLYLHLAYQGVIKVNSPLKLAGFKSRGVFSRLGLGYKPTSPLNSHYSPTCKGRLCHRCLANNPGILEPGPDYNTQHLEVMPSFIRPQKASFQRRSSPFKTYKKFSARGKTPINNPPQVMTTNSGLREQGRRIEIKIFSGFPSHVRTTFPGLTGPCTPPAAML